MGDTLSNVAGKLDQTSDTLGGWEGAFALDFGSGWQAALTCQTDSTHQAAASQQQSFRWFRMVNFKSNFGGATLFLVGCLQMCQISLEYFCKVE